MNIIDYKELLELLFFISLLLNIGLCLIIRKMKFYKDDIEEEVRKIKLENN